MATNNCINKSSGAMASTLVTATGITLDSGSNTLSNYLTFDTYTPVVSFAGGTTGLTATVSGGYSRIGNLIFFECGFYFTAKGSSTGALRITLPTTAAANPIGGMGGFACYPAYIDTNQNWISGFLNASTDYLEFYTSDTSGGGWVKVTNAHCADNSRIYVSGFYWV